MTHAHKLKKGQPCTRITPPNIKVLLTGATHCEFVHPHYRLYYTDGSYEDAMLETVPDIEDWFALTSAIQTTARAKA